MLAIMHALTKFKQYLVGRKFVVKTDHNSLNYFLEQKDLSAVITEISSAQGDKNSASSAQKNSHSWHKD
jgi:hypothetical protein